MAAYGDYAAHGSLLAGDMGTALVAMRLAPSAAMAEFIYTRADANTHLPISGADVGHAWLDARMSFHERNDE